MSLSGESLSPKYAPEITAPATIPDGIPKAFPIPISAIPTVAEVVQLLPVESEITAHIIKQDGKNKSIQLLRVPKFSEVPYPVIMEPNLVIEYYSR